MIQENYFSIIKLNLIILMIIVISTTCSYADPVCNDKMPPMQCAEAQLSAIGQALGSYKAEIESLKTQMPQIGIMSCQTSFTVSPNPPGKKIPVRFEKTDCGGIDLPQKDWTYTATLVGTDICGGFSEYWIDLSRIYPTITFFEPATRFCDGTSSARVDVIAVHNGAFGAPSSQK